MGYDLHITRQENWFDEDRAKQISIEEWKEFVANDPEMRLDNYAEADLGNGEVLRVGEEGLTVWTVYSGSDTVWFGFFKGNISVKNPDDEIIQKMLAIAEKFNARVQGDDGELY